VVSATTEEGLGGSLDEGEGDFVGGRTNFAFSTGSRVGTYV